MFQIDSRYAQLPTATVRLPNGQQVRYVRRRIVPPVAAHRVLATAPPEPGERLDLFAARTLGNPEQFWRICDANGVLDPFLALERPSLDIPFPG